MKAKTTYIIPVWSTDVYAKQVKKQLMEQGVAEENIIFTTEKISRAVSLNKAIANITTEYVGIFDDDVMLAPNVVSVLEDLLDRNPKIGFAIAPVQQMDELAVPKPDLPEAAPDGQSLENQSAKCWTFNACIYRKSCDVILDEDLFGAQISDWDFGLSLLHKGYLSIADHRTAVAHKKTSFQNKNIMYHGVVARNRQIFMTKWKDRDNWTNVADYNKKNNNEIPTLEEITHLNEDKLIEYIAKYDKFGLTECYFNPRFGSNEKLNQWLSSTATKINETEQIFNPKITDMSSIPRF